MKLTNMPWTQKIIAMIQKKDVTGLHKEGFYSIYFQHNNRVDAQADLEDVGISETEIKGYKYTHTGAETRFYVYFWGRLTITIGVPLEKEPNL